MPLQKWVIVGGEDRGGILVRGGQELGSPKLPDRLSTGAVVEELMLIGERLKFRRLTGTGPKEGWISVFLDHKDLAQKLPDKPDGSASREEPRPPRSAPAAPAPPAPGPAAAAAPGPPLLALGGPEPMEAEPKAEKPAGEPADAGGQNWHESAGAGYAEGKDQSWSDEANEPKGPPRFEQVRAAKLPLDTSGELKWLVWNEIWRCVNNKIGSLADGDKKKERFTQAEKDEERCCAHLRKALEVNAFSNSTILQVKRQASAGGHAVAQGHMKGVWLQAARCDALEKPQEMEAELWTGIVKAIRTAAVTIFFMAREEWTKATRFQQDYDAAWREIEEEYTPDPYH